MATATKEKGKAASAARVARRPYVPSAAQLAHNQRQKDEWARRRAERERPGADEVLSRGSDVGSSGNPTAAGGVVDEVAPPSTAPEPAAALVAAETVEVSRGLVAILAGWLPLLDRLRWARPALFGVSFADTAARVRALLEESLVALPAGELTFTGALPPESWRGERVAVAVELWALIEDWPALLRRASWAGAPLSLNEMAQLAEAESLA